MNRLHRSSALAILLAALLIAPVVLAQMCPMEPTLDYIVASADRVAIGHVLTIGEATSGSNGQTHFVTLSLDETPTGDPVRQIEVPFPPRGWAYMVPGPPVVTLQSWQAHKDQLLLAISQFKGKWYVITVIDLDHDTPDMVSADLTLLKTGPEMLRVARAEAHILNSPQGQELLRQKATRQTPSSSDWNAYDNGKLESFTMGCSNEQPSLAGSRFSHEELILPADFRLEQDALATLRGDPSRIGLNRFGAVFALKHFKTEDHVNLIRSLEHDHDSDVRRAAWTVLHNWGVEDRPWREVVGP